MKRLLLILGILLVFILIGLYYLIQQNNYTKSISEELDILYSQAIEENISTNTVISLDNKLNDFYNTITVIFDNLMLTQIKVSHEKIISLVKTKDYKELLIEIKNLKTVLIQELNYTIPLIENIF